MNTERDGWNWSTDQLNANPLLEGGSRCRTGVGPLGGTVDQVGGIVVGLSTPDDYYVARRLRGKTIGFACHQISQSLNVSLYYPRHNEIILSFAM